jgi:Zn-dependent M32 family carboxypeptidase
VYFGVEPPDDARAFFRICSGRAGATLASQLHAWQHRFNAALAADGIRDRTAGEDFAKGRFLGSGLDARKLHRHGSSYEPAEVLERVVGTRELDPAPYLAYLKRKFGEIYKV